MILPASALADVPRLVYDLRVHGADLVADRADDHQEGTPVSPSKLEFDLFSAATLIEALSNEIKRLHVTRDAAVKMLLDGG